MAHWPLPQHDRHLGRLGGPPATRFQPFSQRGGRTSPVVRVVRMFSAVNMVPVPVVGDRRSCRGYGGTFEPWNSNFRRRSKATRRSADSGSPAAISIFSRSCRRHHIDSYTRFSVRRHQTAKSSGKSGRNMVAGRSPCRTEEHQHPPLGQTRYEAVGSQGPEDRIGLHLRCDLPPRRQGSCSRHAALLHRRHEPPLIEISKSPTQKELSDFSRM